MLASLLLPLLAAPGISPAVDGARATPDDVPPTDGVSVRVTRGRGALMREGEVEVLTRGRAVTVDGPAAFELGPGGEAELVWPSLSSLRVTGATGLSFGGAARSVEIEFLQTIEVEVRRDTFSLELPGAWSLEARRSAFGLAERGAGVEVCHHGGSSLRVRSRIPRRRDDWPRWIGPGKPAVLPRADSALRAD